jgi:hypothetical protein
MVGVEVERGHNVAGHNAPGQNVPGQDTSRLDVRGQELEERGGLPSSAVAAERA